MHLNIVTNLDLIRHPNSLNCVSCVFLRLLRILGTRRQSAASRRSSASSMNASASAITVISNGEEKNEDSKTKEDADQR